MLRFNFSISNDCSAFSNNALTLNCTAIFVLSFIYSLTVLASNVMAMSLAKPTIVVLFGNYNHSTLLYIMFHNTSKIRRNMGPSCPEQNRSVFPSNMAAYERGCPPHCISKTSSTCLTSTYSF